MSTQALQALIRLLNDPADASVVTDPASWELIQTHAGAYGVRSLAAFAARPFVSGEERAWCDRTLTANWRRYEQNLLHLEGILALLEKAGIRALVLKGPLLARRYYTPPFLRKSSGDLDLAIQEQDFDRACEALLGIGYEAGQSLAEAKACSHHFFLLHASMARVELHFRLSHGASGIPVEEFFERAVPCELPNGGTAWVLSGADELLHLVLHYAQHRFPMLFHLHELRHIWRVTPLAVQNEVVQKARRYHFVAALAMTDIAFRSTWGEPFLPPG
ncbi:MAG: nucleotidyltransferase family protein, partial [Acidobacteriota bacterium]